MCTISAHGAICDAGFYLDGGECVQCQPGYFCSGDDLRGKCVGATYSETYGATECTRCPISQNNSDDIMHYYYYIYGDVHSRRANCYVEMNVALKHGYLSRLACYVDADGDTYGISGTNVQCDSVVESYTCDGGYYANLERLGGVQLVFRSLADAIENGCAPVGSGFYSAPTDAYRNACPAGTHTTGFGAGADDADDCGVTLHVGETQLHLRAAKETEPSLVVQLGDNLFYGNLATQSRDGVCIDYNGVQYCAYDDTTK